jgi:2-C-methyl-D-erythritol 2,4-cyclodiphosphate synthase
MRIGFGFDTHALKAGLPLKVGGIDIPFDKGSLGHSDADVLIHAICDALLGAAALGDIGQHFPDTDPAYKGIDSALLLKDCCALVRKAGYEISNLDCTVCLEAPKLAPHMNAMRTRLAELMDINIKKVSVKAKTSEKLGFIGQGEGLSAYAMVLIEAVRRKV